MSWSDRLKAQSRSVATTVINAAWERLRLAGAINAEHPLARRYGSMGRGSYVAFPQGDCYNAHAVHLGEDCFIGAGTTLAVGMPTETYPADSPPVIEIGDRTTVGKDCWFVARHSIVLEADVTIAPNVYFTDHNHTYADPWLPVGKQVLGTRDTHPTHCTRIKRDVSDHCSSKLKTLSTIRTAIDFDP